MADVSCGVHERWATKTRDALQALNLTCPYARQLTAKLSVMQAAGNFVVHRLALYADKALRNKDIELFMEHGVRMPPENQYALVQRVVLDFAEDPPSIHGSF